MTPKEKAKELFNKYWDLLSIHNVLNRRLFTKECALIAVDEILNQDKSVFDVTEAMYHFEYWGNVKNEIEQL